MFSAASYGTGHYKAAASGTQNVIVTNAANNPVPVMGNVGINGTASVSISGTPSVSVSGTPNVSISGTPNVKVSNDGNSPVPVQDVNETVRTEKQFQFFVDISANEPGTTYTFYTVPANQTFVIDNVSVDAFIAAGANFYSTTINDAVIHLQADGPDGTGFNWFSTAQPMNYRIAAGGFCTVTMERNGGGNFGTGADFVVTGHLEG